MATKKIIINRNTLLNHLKFGVTTVIRNNQITPAMECVFIRKENKSILFKCSNNEMELISTMEQEDGDDFVVAVKGDIFYSTLNSLKSETVEIKIINDKQFVLISDKKKYAIPAYFSNDFPYVSVNKDTLEGVYIPGEQLCKYTEKALTVIERKSISPVFSCVQVKIHEKILSVTGASSAFMYQCKFNHDTENIEVYLIPAVADTLIAISPKENIYIGTDGKKTVIRIGNMTINALSMADKKYVDVKPVFNAKREAVILFNRNETLESLKRMRNYAGINNDLCIKKDEGEYMFICQDINQGKKAQEVIEVETNDDVHCGVNMKVLQSCFNSMDSEWIRISFGSNFNIPMLVEPVGEFSVTESFILGQYKLPDYAK